MAIKVKVGKRIGNIATILVNVTDDRNKPVDQQPVELLIAGAKFTTGETNDEGDVSFDNIPIDPDADIITITARTFMGGQWVIKDLQINKPPSQKTPKPFALELKSAGGKDGKWVVVATIVAEDGNGVKGDIVVMRANGTIKSYETENNGTKKISVTISGRQEKIRFLVAGTNIDKELHLEGLRTKRPSFLPKKANPASSFWEATRIALY